MQFEGSTESGFMDELALQLQQQHIRVDPKTGKQVSAWLRGERASVLDIFPLPGLFNGTLLGRFKQNPRNRRLDTHTLRR